VLADGGPLSRVLEGFEPRPGQRAMAAAVSETLRDGGILLAEAGTGTGKTLAYLVPAILYGRRTLISTGTKHLQDQIAEKDVPLLREALGIPFVAARMKGRNNYLCLHRFDTLRASPVARSAQDHRDLALVEAWLERTQTGDRAEIEELPESSTLWPDVSAVAEQCLGAECPRYGECFVTRMRQRAAEADLVIVNHHLLCADAAVRQHSFGEVIPEASLAIVDEAHQLEDVATQYFGVTVSSYRFEELVRDGGRLFPSRAVQDAEKATALRRALGRVDDRARRFFLHLRQGPGGAVERVAGGVADRTSDATAGLFDERRRLTPPLPGPVAEAGLSLAGALDEVEAIVAAITEASEDVRAIGRRAAEIREALRFLLLASDPAFVYFLEVRGRGLFLRAMPIDVSSIVRELLFDRMRSTVLTSATLAVDGSFEYARSRLGIEDAREVHLPSEFDYRRQSILYLPRRIPDPRAPGFAEAAAREIADVLVRTDGRAFVLFTSYATLRQVEARLERSIPYPLLVQGDAPRTILLEQFRSTPNAVLLATSSFWQGVDVVGEALSCVIIDKLPFASPGDPIVQARIETIAARGGDAFGEYQVPLAILTLLQGLGRLLRHRQDRGVLAILDPRLRTKGYGRRFLAALPPSPITQDPADISRFFAGDDDRRGW
jgi:ATP-dependent DNA helicase DinG